MVLEIQEIYDRLSLGDKLLLIKLLREEGLLDV